MLTIRYKGLLLARRGGRVAVFREDGDTLGTFVGWDAAIAFIDRLKPGAGTLGIRAWEKAELA